MALLAASRGEATGEVAADMVRVRETIAPRSSSLGLYDDAYLRLVNELEARGWLRPVAAAHARGRVAK
jgi:hypothetical protein